MTRFGLPESAAARAALVRQQRRVIRRAAGILRELHGAIPPGIRSNAWRRAIPRLHAVAEQSLAEAVRLHRRLTIADVLTAWEPIFPDLDAVVTRVLRPAIYEQLRRHLPVPVLVGDMTQASQRDLIRLIGTALAEGRTTAETARAVEVYLAGRQTTVLRPDVITATDRRAAAFLRHRALRLAVSELNFARQETERALFAASGEVATVQWVRSSNRGTARIPDVCDMLATINAFGLGRGVYPLARAPMTPHPFCRCRLLPLRRGGQAVQPVPVEPPEAIALNASTARQRRIAQDAIRAMGDGEDFMDALGRVLR